MSWGPGPMDAVDFPTLAFASLRQQLVPLVSTV